MCVYHTQIPMHNVSKINTNVGAQAKNLVIDYSFPQPKITVASFAKIRTFLNLFNSLHTWLGKEGQLVNGSFSVFLQYL